MSFLSRDLNLYSQTRVHSSRMRTGRSLTVCQSSFPGVGVLSPGSVLSPGGCT